MASGFPPWEPSASERLVRRNGSRRRMKFHLGSCTKAMTATLIGQLLDAKTLTLDTPMQDIFPGIRPTMNPQMAKVTVAELLQHTGGLPPNVDWWAIDATKKPLPAQRRMVVEEVLTAEPKNPPGTKYVYSNVGFVVLGAILEEKTGKPWEKLIDERLFTPLEMTTAGFGPPGEGQSGSTVGTRH